mgnify:CR=1 FL=1
MKKRANKTNIKTNTQTKDKFAVAIFFIAGLMSSIISQSNLTTRALGIAFIIAGVYGIVAISKNQKFIFN